MKTILIVDDIFENIYFLRVILEKAGYTVIEAKDGKEALDILDKNSIDLIISDILMPVMDGYMFCQACKKNKEYKDIPFVFYTSTYIEKPDEEFALKLGANHFLRKPTDPDVILSLVGDLLADSNPNIKPTTKVKFTEKEVLKLYSKRLISKLEQKNLELENEVLERTKAQQVLKKENEVLDLIATNTALKKIFNHILLNYESVNPENKGSISVLQDDGVHLDLVSAPSLPKPYKLALERVAIGENVGSCGRSAFIKKPVIVSDISTDALWVDYKAIALKHHLKSCWSIPILSEKNEVLGTFAIYSNTIKTPALEDIQELNSAVRLARIAIVKFNIMAEVKEKDESYKSLVNQASDIIITCSFDGTIYDFNKAALNYLGYTKSEFSKLKIQDIIIGDVIQYPENKQKLLQGHSIITYRQFLHKKGTRIDVEISSKLQKDGLILGIIRDVTERKKAELDLKLAKEFTDNLVMSMQEGLLIVNLEGKIMMVNDSFCEMLGYSEAALIGLDLPYPFAKTEDFEDMSKTKEKVATGDISSFQFEFIRKNGEKFLASFLSGNIKNDKGEVIALFGTVKDVSEEERAKRILEENVARSKQKKDVILKLARLVGEDLDVALQSITKLAATTLNVERVSIWSFNSEKTTIYCEKLFVLSDGLHTSGPELKMADNKTYFDLLNKEQAILIPDVVNDSVTKGLAQDYLIPNNIASLMDVFINSTEGYYGILCFEHIGEPREWTADEQEFASSIASIVSLMVEGHERKVAEENLVLANTELSNANSELNALREQLEQENVYLRNELDLVFNYEEMVYGSEAFSNVLSEVEKVAPTTATVLLIGESGTGKELLARAVHNTSSRNNKPLIKVNCSAIPRELMESELFGHKKGSFTGATSDKIGKFELADGGTLFLDEIGELPLDMQPKILRFLQEGEIEVVGGTTGSKKLDVRVIAATNRNLKEAIEKKQFREDLYFRLNVFPIEVPSLRKRVEDIPFLVEHFMDKFNKAYGKNIKYIADESMSKLKAYDWPGNIRELENLIERASILATSDTLVIPGFESSAHTTKPINKKDLSFDAAQRNHILQVLERCDWKISGAESASALLKLKPSTLRDKMTKLGIMKP
ncbi:sigma 54-interacting transcriptional regulator [Lacinutrix sp. Hel_I_90]|uniref:sigma 54-interacting transcriptional regulator n=1 Tax=Lacinutrix sp. Hel_I_90 TaxID=1249999 RepID=UPI0009E35AE9|nr:sigma 54-interacting transcriptional regulator [Lacinutrix sp. Hel_I_90]